MAVYNFKKEAKFYIVYGGLKYVLDVYPDVTWSQTFSETAIKVKTLHEQTRMFDDAVITKANPANFNFTIPLMQEDDLKIVMNLLLDFDPNNVEAALKTADFYVELNSEIYKLEKAVFESGVFLIVRDKYLSLNISGSAKKLTKFTGVIPGTLQARSSTYTYIIPTANEVTINGIVQPTISSISLEVRNDIQWVDFETLHSSLNVTSASDTMYPEDFVVQGKTLSGTIQQYTTDETSASAFSWANGVPMRIRVGSSSSNWILDINIPSAVYTNRVDSQEVLMQGYDFRMTSSPSNLSDVVNYI